ncbi:MAG: hypothetical protein FWF30_03245 [Coriobacteriia bacterium]|nr:hypothetical protein [Coriobacteriia bacterium]
MSDQNHENPVAPPSPVAPPNPPTTPPSPVTPPSPTDTPPWPEGQGFDWAGVSTGSPTGSPTDGQFDSPIPPVSPYYLDELPLDLKKQAREVKSRRTKRSLIIVIIVLVVLAGVLCWLGYRFFLAPSSNSTPALTAVSELDPSAFTQAPETTAPVFSTSNIPNLTVLFGKTTDEVSTSLGDGWVSVKEEAQNDPSSPDVATLATYSYTATALNGGDGTDLDAVAAAQAPTAHLYLSLDQNGQVIDVYYTADLGLLAYPDVSFIDLLKDDTIILGALDMAGIGPKDFTYTAPDLDSSLTYDNPDSQNKKITKQSQIFSGRTSNDGAPTAWVIKVTYEFVPPVASLDDNASIIRTISIQLS